MKAALQGRNKCAKLLLFAGKFDDHFPSLPKSKGDLHQKEILLVS